MSAAREQSCVWWAPSGCPETEKTGFLTAQSEPWAPSVVSPKKRATQGFCTSIRAVGCSLRGSAQILQFKVKRCVLLQSDRVILLDYGEDVEGEAAREREEQLVSCRQAGQQQWSNKRVTEQEQRGIIGVVLVTVRRGVITAGKHGATSSVWCVAAVLVPPASSRFGGARGQPLTGLPSGGRTGVSN